MPFTTALGETYDSGDFTAHLDKALAEAGWHDVDARKAKSRARGRLRGIGLSTYVEADGGCRPDWADLQVRPAGTAAGQHGTRSTRPARQPPPYRLRPEARGDTST